MIKHGVKLKGLQPQMVLAYIIAKDAYRKWSGADCVITSALDGTHMEESKHYRGLAIDLRINNLSSRGLAKNITRCIAELLGAEYDVLLEATHIHIEFDPKESY